MTSVHVSMVKLQHYVPQVYLKAFACEDGKNATIWCYDKTSRLAFKTNVRNVGGENYFYHPSGEADQSLERKFSELEQLFAVSRQRLFAATNRSQLPADDQIVIVNRTG